MAGGGAIMVGMPAGALFTVLMLFAALALALESASDADMPIAPAAAITATARRTGQQKVVMAGPYSLRSAARWGGPICLGFPV
jgi:hypothetical protein